MESLVRVGSDNESRFFQCFLGWNFSSFCHLRKTLGQHGGRTPRPATILGTRAHACAEARVAQARRANLWLRVFFLPFALGNEISMFFRRMVDGQSVASSERGAPSRNLASCRRTLLRLQSLFELCF